MEISALNSIEDYNSALNRLEVIFHALPGSPEGAELERLVAVIEDYEKHYFPIE